MKPVNNLQKKNISSILITGQSIKTLKDAGRPFWSTWHKDYPNFEASQSRLSEVAINPNQLYLPKSNSKTLDQQLEMVIRLSQDISRKVPGVEAVIGEAPDYVELAFTYLDTTGKRLFGKDYNYNYARTVTPVGSRVARVGRFNADRGLGVRSLHPDGSLSDLWAAPLVVPSRK